VSALKIGAARTVYVCGVLMALGIIGDLVDDMRIIHGIRVLDSL